MSFRKSVNKANHGPTIDWHGGECPVAPGTPVSVMLRSEQEGKYAQGYWKPVRTHPERLRWTHTGAQDDILAYYERLPIDVPRFGKTQPHSTSARDPLRSELIIQRRIYEHQREEAKRSLSFAIEQIARLDAEFRYHFASAGEAGTATTVQQGVVHEHATPEGGDAQ